MRGGRLPAAVLLDTCAVIWLANGDAMQARALDAISRAATADGVYVSPVSAWEVGMLSRSGRAGALSFLPDAKTWFVRVMVEPGIRAAPLTPEIAIDASFLSGDVQNDSADRLVMATSRHLGIPVVTRDGRMIAYAGTGQLRVIAC